MRKLITLIFVFVSLSIFSQNGFYNGWGQNGNTVGNNTSFIGPTDNRSLLIKANNTQYGKVDSIGRVFFGANPANTTLLGGMTLGYNTTSGMMHFGKFGGTSNSIWGYHSGTPTTSNYNLNFDASNAYFNAPSSVFLVTNGTIRFAFGTATSYNTLPFRVGSNVAPSATLDVTGTMSVSGSYSAGGRVEFNQGVDVASAAGAITLGSDGNVFEFTGTDAVTLISSTGYKNGSEITLLFTSTASLTDGTANSGANIGFELAGNANFTGSADDSITLILCEIGGTQRWREKCRSVN